MPEPLLATGLATDWLKKLHKLWGDIRESRRQELLEIKNIFGDPELLARFYIEPDCQHINPADHDEDEPGRAIREPIMSRRLNEFLKGEFFERDGRNTVFILSDAGMGKTSLLMMLKLSHLVRFWPDGLDFKLLKLGPETLDAVAQIRDHGKTVLLLDALDEDPTAWGRIEERLTELLQATQSFRQVILTCRTQFFPDAGAAPIEKPGKVEVGGFICNLLYLSSFNDEQVDAYLKKVYPDRWMDLLRNWLTKKEHRKRTRAKDALRPMRSLRMRPMLLAHIDELVASDLENWSEYQVYKALVRHWLLREERKQKGRLTEEQLWEACMTVALALQSSGKRVLSPQDLATIFASRPVAKPIEAFDVGGRSLLNRTSDGGFRFSHYSIQEFLVAHRLVTGTGPELSGKLKASDQMLAFLVSWIGDAPRERLGRVPWRALDFEGVKVDLAESLKLRSLDLRGTRLRELYLKGVDLHGIDLAGADLCNAVLDEANLEGTILTSANLAGASFVSANLTEARLDYCDARDGDFRHARLHRSHLRFGRFSGSDFRDAELEDAVTEGAAFWGTKDLQDDLDATAGPAQTRTPLRVVPQPQRSFGARCSAFNPNRSVLAVGTPDGAVRLWRARDGALLATLEGLEREVSCLAWHPDPRKLLLAAGSTDGSLAAWRVDNCQLSLALPHETGVLAVAWHPAKEALAVGLDDGSIKVLGESKLSLLTMHNREAITALAWSKEGLLGIGSVSGAISIVTEEAHLEAAWPAYTLGIVSLSWGGSEYLASSDGRTVKLFRVRGHSLVYTAMVPSHGGEIWRWYGLSGSLSLGLEDDGAVRLLDVEGVLTEIMRETRLEQLPPAAEGIRARPVGQPPEVNHISCDEGCTCLSATRTDGSTTIWNLVDGRVAYVLDGPTIDIPRQASGTVELWRGAREELLYRLGERCLWIAPFATELSNPRLVSYHEGRMLKLRELSTGRVLAEWADIRARRVFRSGMLLVIVTEDGVACCDVLSARLSSFRKGEALEQLAGLGVDEHMSLMAFAGMNIPPGPGRILTRIGHPVRQSIQVDDHTSAFSADGHRLFTGTRDGRVLLWEVDGETVKKVAELYSAYSPLRGLIVTADGYVDGPRRALEQVRFADGWALYDLNDMPERHNPDRVRQVLRPTLPPTQTAP